MMANFLGPFNVCGRRKIFVVVFYSLSLSSTETPLSVDGPMDMAMANVY